jgi:hypothetical protein
LVGAGAPGTGAAGVEAAGGAAHLVQIVDVDVTYMVEMLGVAKTVVLPASVIV